MKRGTLRARPPVTPAVVASALPRRGQAELARHPRARSFSTLLFVKLDVAARYEPFIAVGEICSGHADEERVLASTRLSIITGVYSVRVAGFLVHLGIALERPAVAFESNRGHTCVRAVHIDAPTRSAIIVIGKRRFGFIIHRDKPEIGGETRRLGSDLAATGDLLCPWRRWRRLAGAGARRDDETGCCCELVGEVCADLPAGSRVVRSMVRADLRVDLAVIGKRHIGEVLPVKGDLEKVGKAAVRPTTKAAC